MFRFIKLRAMWAHGPGAWEYKLIEASEASMESHIEELLFEEEEKHAFSDKFRKIEVDMNPEVPLEEVRRWTFRARAAAKAAERRLTFLEGLEKELTAPSFTFVALRAGSPFSARNFYSEELLESAAKQLMGTRLQCPRLPEMGETVAGRVIKTVVRDGELLVTIRQEVKEPGSGEEDA